MPKSQPQARQEQAIRGILKRMTLKEKLSQLVGMSHMRVADIPRLGVGFFKMADGPVGVRHGKATGFPGPIAAAATWDPALVQRMGEALGQETLEHGRNLLLAPCINIHRHPLGGRNFESYGEDPYLAGKTAAAYIRGLQSKGAGCSVKHFAVNNQEKDRVHTSAEIDERSMREIYLPAFKAAIQEGGAWTVMAAYNKVNGKYCVEQDHLLVDILKKEWGFDGLVMSDWGATHASVDPANGGLDLEMPNPDRFGKKLKEKIRKGEVTQAVIDDKVLRILRIKARMGLIKGVPAAPRKGGKLKATALARQVAAESVVLLKNQGSLLPFKKGGIRSLAVIGPNADAVRAGGGGSAIVDSPYNVTVLEGLKKALPGVHIVHAPGQILPDDLLTVPAESLSGLTLTLYKGDRPKGRGVSMPVSLPVDLDWNNDKRFAHVRGKAYVARLTGKLLTPVSGEYRIGLEHTHKAVLTVAGKKLVESGDFYWTGIRSKKIRLKGGAAVPFQLDWKIYTEHREIKMRLGWETPENLLAQAKRVAAACDAAVVVTGFSKHFESEGWDRPNLELFKGQISLVRAVCAANKRTAVAVINGGAISGQGWLPQAKAVLECWYPGQEGGNAIADVLTGKVNPGARLPMSFPKRLADIPAAKWFPGTKKEVFYKEGMRVGYRHFDQAGVRPEFPFGHGLSYTRFSYSGLKATVKVGLPEPVVEIQVTVKNSGAVAGKEVVQIYVEDPIASLPRPKKELKAFGKVALAKGQSKRLKFTLKADAFSFYHPSLKAWVAEAGAFAIHAGSSSRDIKAVAKITL